MTEALVLDASAMITMLMGGHTGQRIIERLRGTSVHVPAHFDAEVLSSLGRLQRAGDMSASAVEARLERLAAAPFERHPLAPLLTSAWRVHGNTRLVDALYVALATEIGAMVITLDRGLSVAAPRSELIMFAHDREPEMGEEQPRRLPEERWDEFMSLLHRDPVVVPGLVDLIAEPSVLDE